MFPEYKYLKFGRTFLISVPIAIFCDAYITADKKKEYSSITPWKFALVKTIPLSTMTSFAGWMSELPIPKQYRKAIYHPYSWFYGCKLEEAELESLEDYPCFSDFFSRKLKKGIRPSDSSSFLQSPSDGLMYANGTISAEDCIDNTKKGKYDQRVYKKDILYPEQIKGVTYKIGDLLKEKRIPVPKDGNEMYYCSIYLSPGDYHRFHSPISSMKIKKIKSIKGDILPVAPWVMRNFPHLVTLNERSVIETESEFGKFFFVPVGATNVRSIILDPSIVEGATIDRGADVGHFKLGSLIVLLFEAPKGFKWTAQPGSPVKVGESLLKREK